jgi:tetratricopeptide (TPR) repeat protein
VVPVDIAVYDSKQGKPKDDGANATIRGNVLLKGEVTPFEIPVENEPKRFWLNLKGKVYGLFFDQERHTKLVLLYQAVNAAEAGRADEAMALFDRARAATEPPPEKLDLGYATLKWRKRAIDAQIELGRARLLLDQGKDDQADDSLGRAARIFGDTSEFNTLQARLEVRRGNHDKAFRQLRKGMADEELDSEGYALLAVAARASGHTEEYAKALKRAKASGADVAALVTAGAAP